MAEDGPNRKLGAGSSERGMQNTPSQFTSFTDLPRSAVALQGRSFQRSGKSAEFNDLFVPGPKRNRDRQRQNS